MPGQELLRWWWIRETFKFEDWDVAKGSSAQLEIKLGRFGISVNGLLARETTAVPIYISAPGDGHIFGLGGIFAGGFPDFSQGAALLDTARTVPGHCLNTQFVSTSCAITPMVCRRATAGFQSVLDQWQSRHMDTSFKRREGWPDQPRSGLWFLQPIEASRIVSCGVHTNLAF